MPPHTRWRNSPSPDHPSQAQKRKPSGLSVITSSSSFDDLHSLSSQSLHQALHPQEMQSSPSKIPDRHAQSYPFKVFNIISCSHQKIGISSLFMLGRDMFTKVKLSTWFVLGTMFAIGTMQRLHHFADMYSTPAQNSVQGTHNENWDAPSQQQQHHENTLLRRKRARGTANERHPRVTHAAATLNSVNDSDASFFSFFGRLLSGMFPFVRRKKVDDPMLHHDGWKPETNSYVSSDNYGEIQITHHTEKIEEEAENQCVPMAQWQTTSYPNCNTVHEIDLVLSSGVSLTFPRVKPEPQNRRTITLHPPILRKYMEELLHRYPNNRKQNAKLNAMGMVREESIMFLGQGWFRSAWKMVVDKIPEYDEDEEEWVYEESVVLKTLRIEREFIEEYYELHRRDALAMERLTFSPYVLDIYGYCGQSAINELANFGIEGMSSLEKIARSFRGMDDIEPVSKIKLQLASMVAAGVSHMHSIDYPDFPELESDDSGDSDDDGSKPKSLYKSYDGVGKITSNATLVHYDLNPRNIAVVKRGKPKLNDFNVAEFMTWDTKNNRTCGFKGRFREPWWRAPEEMHFHMSNYTNPEPLTEKIDIYSLGNILWDILTTHSPRGKMTKDLEYKYRPKVARGELPEWPDDFNQTKLTTDPALIAIHKAMIKCLRANPKERPTAGEIAAELADAIENLPEGFGDKEKWKAMMNARNNITSDETD